MVRWNTTIGEKFLKGDIGEISVTATDVREQDKSTNPSITESDVQYSCNRTLRRYVQALPTHSFR